MQMHIKSSKIWFAATLGGCLLLMQSAANAMPSFARQTGMNCNSCHIGTDNVPNFTRTGRIFSMRGYTRPVIRSRLRHDGHDAAGNTTEANEHYGGNYLALNLTEFFAGRFVTEFYQDSEANDGSSRDASWDPAARFSMFYTGPVTDWLGMWTEIGYLGNNALNSVTTGQDGQSTGLNLFAFDEFRISTSRMIGDKSFIGASFGNEHPNVIAQFNFPIFLPDMWYTGQGGTGRARETGSLSLYGFFGDKVWVQYGLNSGADDQNLDNGVNHYFNIAYDGVPGTGNRFKRTKSDLWTSFEFYTGSDFLSIVNPTKSSFICPGTCPPGVTDAVLSITNAAGFTAAPISDLGAVETVDDFKSYKLSIQHSAADVGIHSWYAGLTYHYMDQDYDSGASAERSILGASLRYFFNRTYSAELFVWDDLNYEYTDPTGVTSHVASDINWYSALRWNPSMNISVHLDYRPTQNYVLNSANHLSEGHQMSLGMEYSY